jgi:hypothetical protein
VGIAKTQNPAIVFAGFAAVDFHEAEVAQSIVSEAVGLTPDGELRRGEGAL